MLAHYVGRNVKLLQIGNSVYKDLYPGKMVEVNSAHIAKGLFEPGEPKPLVLVPRIKLGWKERIASCIFRKEEIEKVPCGCEEMRLVSIYKCIQEHKRCSLDRKIEGVQLCALCRLAVFSQ